MPYGLLQIVEGDDGKDWPKPTRSLLSFARRLRTLREAAGLSISDLAEKAGLSRQAVHLLESGEREPSFETVKKLAAALGKSTAAFE